MLAIALALIVLGALLLVTWNAEQLLARWSSAAEFSVYLRDDATSEQRGAIETAIDQSGVADGREYVSKAEALTRFRREFAELASLTSGFDDNPFPASIEVRVRPERGTRRSRDALVQAPGGAAGRGRRRATTATGWPGSAAGLGTIRAAGLALALLMALAAAVTVATVVRLGLQARRDEIEIMELVGAPLAFIRGPVRGRRVPAGRDRGPPRACALWVGFLVAMAWWGTDLSSLLDGGIRAIPADSARASTWSRAGCWWAVSGGLVAGAGSWPRGLVDR